MSVFFGSSFGDLLLAMGSLCKMMNSATVEQLVSPVSSGPRAERRPSTAMAFLARAREDARKVRDSGSGSTPPSSKESGGLRHSGRDVPKEGKVERSGSGSASSSPASMKTKTMSPPAVAIPRAPSSNLKGEAPPNAFVEVPPVLH